MGRHDDEITASLCGDADNRLVRVGAVCCNRIALDTCLRSRSCDDREVVIRTLSGGLNDSLLFIGDHFGAVRENVKLRDDMDSRDFRAPLYLASDTAM